MRRLPLHSTPMLLGQLGFTIACCVTVRYTMARTMPEDGIYHIMSVLQLTYKFNYRIAGNDIELYANPER